MKGFAGKIEKGLFLERPNRFTVLVDVNGRVERAFLPNPGRLWELLLPSAILYLEEGKGRLPYTVVAVEKDGRPVYLHTHRMNDVALALIEAGLVRGLEGAKVLGREVLVGDSRFDFMLDVGGRRVVLEVKSCTLFSKKVAMFPDAVTERGRRHVEGLSNLRHGLSGAILFLVQSREVLAFLPEFHTDPLFAEILFRAREQIEVIPLGMGFEEDLSLSPKTKVLPIPWEKVVLEDKGAYMLVLKFEKGGRVSVGSLGEINIRKGFYVYVGSAKRGLSKRLERHKAKEKQVFWHIDYLRPYATVHACLPIRTREDVECMVAEALDRVAERVPHFGASDCRCPSHLFYFPSDPLKVPSFIETLLYFRMDRLMEA